MSSSSSSSSSAVAAGAAGAALIAEAVGGYPMEWFLEPERVQAMNVVCAICTDVVRDPLGCNGDCPHLFCKSCITQYLNHQQQCPVCFHRLSLNAAQGHLLYPIPFAKQLVLNQKVYCKHRTPHGCNWQGDLHDLHKHLDHCCLFEQVPCSFCNKRHERRHISTHQALCSCRPVKCTYCSESLIWKQVRKHLKHCAEVPVSCPDGCGAEGLTRGQMQSHKESCPCVMVSCPYGGCSTPHMPRSQLHNHLISNALEHLDTVTQKLHLLETEVLKKRNTSQAISAYQPTYQLGQLIDYQDNQGVYHRARITQLRLTKTEGETMMTVRPLGSKTNEKEWISSLSARVAVAGTHIQV